MKKCVGGSKVDGRLLEIWAEVLGRPHIGLLDDFFAEGGSSMQAIEMLWTVSSEFSSDIDYTEFFKDPCIRRLLELLGKRASTEVVPAEGASSAV